MNLEDIFFELYLVVEIRSLSHRAAIPMLQRRSNNQGGPWSDKLEVRMNEFRIESSIGLELLIVM